MSTVELRTLAPVNTNTNDNNTNATSGEETKTGGGGGFRSGSTAADDRARRADRRAAGTEIASFDEAAKYVDKTFRCVGQTESLIDALKGLDPKLVSTMSGDAQGMFIRHVVQDGEIGLGSDTGKALFYRPGQYRRIGFGCSFERSVPTRGHEDRQHLIEWMDITYLSIPAGHVAVIQKGHDQYVIGPGRYLIRQPTVLLGVTNLNKLKQEDKVKVYTEEPVEKRDIVTGLVRLETVVKTKELTAGWREQTGAITFIRPAPGFRYVTRSTNGAYNIGDTFKVMRSHEHFVRFLDYQKYSRTTKTFSFQSKDFQNVELRVQLSWRLQDGEQWLESAGGYEDIFDALEEKAQALFRDAVGSLSHEEALDQRKEGFEKLEKTVRPALQTFAYDLGGELVDVQIRELLFPVVLARQQELAKREQENKEKLLAAEREINLQKLAEKKATEQQNADLQRKRELAEQTANIERVEAQRELAKVIAKSEREKAQVVAEAERQKAQRAGEKELAAVLATKAEIEANSQAAVRAIQAKQEADGRKEAADAEAHAIRSKAAAEAEAALKLAQAKAEGVRLMGEAFRSNPDVFRLEMARIIAETERVKAIEIARALSANPNALLPAELQRDLLRMKMGFQPEVPQLLTSADLLLPGATKDALTAVANGKKDRDH